MGVTGSPGTTTSTIGSESGMTRSRAGFTLIEVMLAVCVLALGTVMVQQGFLRCAGLFREASHRLAAESWINSKLAETREKVVYAEMPDLEAESGVFIWSGRSFDWRVSIDSEPAGKDLYRMTVSAQWLQSGRPASISKESYVTLRSAIQ